MRKPLLTIIAGIIIVVFGFIFLLRGCLSKYDERFAHLPALYFEKGGKALVFTITEFQKTTSYSRKNGMTSKSVSTSYYVQTNDAVTAELVAEKKVKKHKEIKSYPVEVLGAAGENAWIFMGEPMAFNAFTLDKVADISILETKNPSLAGKFPAERQYYKFNATNGNIYFTAIDGTKWELNTQTLVAKAAEYNENDNPLKQRTAELERQSKQVRTELDSLYQQKSVAASRRLAAKEITYAEYSQLSKLYYAERTKLDKVRDSIDNLLRLAEATERAGADQQRVIDNLRQPNRGYYSIKVNQDTIYDLWYGLYSKEELSKLYDRVQFQSENDETARRKLYTTKYSPSRYGNDKMIDKQKLNDFSSAADYLHGGFLLDKKTGHAVHLGGLNPFLVLHKDQIGSDAKILISRVSTDGKILWTFNTKLKEWGDWINTSTHLFVFGTDNKDLSSSETNVLWCIDLLTGKATRYDYFSRKVN